MWGHREYVIRCSTIFLKQAIHKPPQNLGYCVILFTVLYLNKAISVILILSILILSLFSLIPTMKVGRKTDI